MLRIALTVLVVAWGLSLARLARARRAALAAPARVSGGNRLVA